MSFSDAPPEETITGEIVNVELAEASPAPLIAQEATGRDEQETLSRAVERLPQNR